MATLTFNHAPMGGGKSLAALVRHHHVVARGLPGLLIVMNPRESGVVTSRLGVSAPADVITPEEDLYEVVAVEHARAPLHHVVADEAHFYTPAQVEQLARVVDDLEIPVEAYGLLTDFRTRLFPGSQRLIELADHIVQLPGAPLCACGTVATHNARLVDGVMTTDGDQVLVGDMSGARVRYEPVCRACHIGTIVTPEGLSGADRLR